MTSHPNEAVLARFYEQFPGGDLAPLITEDALALIGGSNALSGHHQGRRDTVASLAAYRAAAPDGIDSTSSTSWPTTTTGWPSCA